MYLILTCTLFLLESAMVSTNWLLFHEVLFPVHFFVAQYFNSALELLGLKY